MATAVAKIRYSRPTGALAADTATPCDTRSRLDKLTLHLSRLAFIDSANLEWSACGPTTVAPGHLTPFACSGAPNAEHLRQSVPERQEFSVRFSLERARWMSELNVKQYALITSDRVHVDVFTRDAGGRWVLSSFEAPGDEIELGSIECRLLVSGLYDKTGLLYEYLSQSPTVVT